MTTNRRILTLLFAAAVGTAAAQTAVDLSRQGKLGTGTTLPVHCTVGQVFFNTAAPSGANLYACTTPNNWVPVGMPALAGDASGTQQSLTVKGIQGRGVSAAVPADQNVLRFNGGTGQWEPTVLPAVGTAAPPGSCSSGNLYLQSDPSNNLQQLYVCIKTNTWTMTGTMSGPSSQRPTNCVAGQTWISTDTPALSYCSATGNPGTWTLAGTGPQGPPGPQGPAGPGGNTVLSGAGAPSASAGSNGDFYLNTAAACLYGPKAAGVWPGSCVGLVGQAGPQGPTGAAGPQGPAGSGVQYAMGGGTAQAQAATYSPAVTSLPDGIYLCWKPAAANTAAAPTFSPNGLTAKPIVKVGGAALVPSDIVTSAVACVVYNSASSHWELQNPQTQSVGGSGTLTANLPSGNPGSQLTQAQSGNNNVSTVLDPFGTIYQGGNWQGGIAANIFQSGQWNPGNYGNLFGLGYSIYQFGGHNQVFNLDKKSAGAMQFRYNSAGAGQHVGLDMGMNCYAAGDCVGITSSITPNSFISAQGDEGAVPYKADIYLQTAMNSIVVTSVTNNGASTTLSAGISKSSGCQTPATCDYRVIPLTSSTGFSAGQWITIDNSPFPSGTVDTIQIIAVSGACGGSTLAANQICGLPQSDHSGGAPVVAAPVLAADLSGVGMIGQDRTIVDITASPVTTGNVDVSVATVTAHGGANFTNTMVGGNVNLPGCIAFPKTDILPSNINDAGSNGTVLTGNITNSTSPIPVQNSTIFGVYDTVSIANEQMLVTAIPDGTHLTVTRGYNGTTAASHGTNDWVVLGTRMWYQLTATGGATATLGSPLQFVDLTVNYQLGAQTLTATDYVVRPCGVNAANDLTYNTAANPPTITENALVIQGGAGYGWGNGHVLRQAVPPMSVEAVGMQAAVQTWNWFPTTNVTPVFRSLNNGRVRLESAFQVESSAFADSDTTAGYFNGVIIKGNTANGSLAAIARDLSGKGLALATFAAGAGSVDHKQIHWEGGAGAASLYPDGNEFVIDSFRLSGDPSTGSRVLLKATGTNGSLLLNYNGLSAPRVWNIQDASGSPALVNPGYIGSMSLPDTTGNAIELGYVSGATDAVIEVVITSCCSDSPQAAYMFNASLYNHNPTDTWQFVTPLSGAWGPGYANNTSFTLEAMVTSAGNNLRLRLRRSGGAATGVNVYPYVNIIHFGGTPAWTTTGTTSSGVTTPTISINGVTSFASLGSVPPRGTFIYCQDCTAAATCAGGGAGHMAVSNGTAWTCQ